MKTRLWLAVLLLGVVAVAGSSANASARSDPGGVVQESDGTAIPGATVTLLRSDTAGGPFVQVPNGSAIMSPANRNNPDHTDASGHFGWGVTAGFYEVQATAPTCDTVTSPVIAAPPDTTNLVLQLTCATVPDPQHGISFTKGCASPTQIGQPYSCTYSVRNNVDEAQDTLTISGLNDTVHSGGGDVSSGNIFTSLAFDNAGTSATCSGPGLMGTGTSADPWTNANKCTLPFGSRVNVHSSSHYTVQSGDFNLPGHALSDSASLTWNDLCDGFGAGPIPGGGNCSSNPPPVGAASQTIVTQLPSTTSTAIHNAAHAIVTTVGAGATVHDFVTVSGGPGNPVPTGTASVQWFTNNTCTGGAAASKVEMLGAAGTVDATDFPQGPLGAGLFAFQAHYLGDPANPVYAPSDGACEPLTVVDANVQISPATATNRVGSNHVLTCHVNVNPGTGFMSAPDGTMCTVTILSGPGSPTSQSCSTSGGSGSCNVTITSAVTGVTTVQASTSVTVGGVALSRTTGDGLAGDGANAKKTWVDAKITISPNATNEVKAPHTFTVTLMKDVGDGAGFVPAAGEHVDFTLSNSNGATHTAATGTCTGGGANTNAAGQCTITFTSPAAGKVTGHATSTLTIGGIPVTVATDGIGNNSADAVKTFVDARISISPNGTNRIGQSHVFTAHVDVNDGSGAGFVPAPAGTSISFSIDSGPGSFTTPNPCTTTGATGSCQITLSSAVTGATSVSAHTAVSVGSVSLTRATNGTGGNSGPATKTWVNARIHIAPNATNAVGQPHTFTVTLEKDVGDGNGFVPAAGEHVTVTLTDAGGAAHTAPTGSCTNAGANTDAAGQCTITFTSTSAGTVTGHGTSTLSVAGSAPFTVATDGVAPNGPDAVKTFVDANIAITPTTASNPIGSNHVLTITVNAIGATIDPGPHTATASIVSGPGSFVGSPSCTYTGGAATASCTVTITSTTAGTTVVSATSNIPVAGLAITRTTGTAQNTASGGSGNASKTWVAAKISIAPAATNEINHSHTFTVTLQKDSGSGFQPAAGEHVTVTLTDSNGAAHTAPTGSCTTAGPNTDVNGQCTITFSSPSAGKVTGHATATLSVGGIPITVATDGVAPNSGDAVKTFVDANISITPNGTNRVGAAHVFTAHVNVNDGSGAGYVNAPDGTSISFAIDSGPGAFSTPNPCTTAGGTGSCQVTLTSSVTGVTTVSAHTTVSLVGLSVHRDTNGTGGSSGPATKTWVNAKLAIAPAATNEVGHSHTFTVTLMKDIGDGNGFVPAAGEHVTVTLTDSNGAAHTAPTGSCTTAGANTDASGQCTITFSSPSAGKVTGHATATLSVGGIPITVATDGVAPNSGDAVKTFVDANISITPNGTNRVGAAHVFTAHVNLNDGTGFANAPNGTSINFTIDSGPGSFTTTNPCTTAGGTGSCQITLTSSTTGVTKVSAHTTLSVGGVSLTRNTDGTGGSSGPATKTWVNARIAIAPSATNEVGHSHTFTVTLMKDTGTGTFVPASGEHVTVTLTDSNGASHGTPTGSCTNAGANTDVNGQCTITFVSNTAGKVTGHASATLTIGTPSTTFTVQTDGTGLNSADAVKTFVDANIQITPPTATNPVGTTHTLTGHVNVNTGTGGFVPAPDGTVITFSLTNAGGATATFVGPSTCTTGGGTGSCTVVISSPTAGTTTIHASTTLSVGGVTLTRATADGKPNDSPDAQKLWTSGGGVVTQFCVACSDVLSTNVPPQFVIGDITYGQFAGRIHGRSPGQLYYWAIVTTTTPNQVVTVSQSNTSTNNTVPLKVGSVVWIYGNGCSVMAFGTPNQAKTGASFTVATPGTYVIEVEFDTNVLENQPVPVPSTIQYTFTTSLGGSASVTLEPQ
jgi:phosphoheptose isomerase